MVTYEIYKVQEKKFHMTPTSAFGNWVKDVKTEGNNGFSKYLLVGTAGGDETTGRGA